MTSMNPSPAPHELPDSPEIPNDPLTQLELQIARRADELIRIPSPPGSHDPWMQAEREVITRTIEAEAQRG